MSKENQSAKEPASRSAIMRAVRASGTGPEMAVRRALFAQGYRYRLRSSHLPGKPDIIFPGRRRAIFVHGCFWHGHDCRRGARQPLSNADYWRHKIARNRLRDAACLDALAKMDWRCCVVWECELKDRGAVMERLNAFLATDKEG